MTPPARPRFDPEVLRALAGAAAVARGESYQADRRVAPLAVEPDRILARVEGTELYRFTFAGRGRTTSGTCTCPATEAGAFCKHLVATASGRIRPPLRRRS